jgi:hypothetical protein
MAHDPQSPYASSHTLHGSTHVHFDENFPTEASGPKTDVIMSTVVTTLPPRSPIAYRNTVSGSIATPHTNPPVLPPTEADLTQAHFKQKQNYSHNCRWSRKLFKLPLISGTSSSSSRSYYSTSYMGIRQSHARVCPVPCDTHVGGFATLLGLACTGTTPRAELPDLGCRFRWWRARSICYRKCYELDTGMRTTKKPSY